MATHDSWEVSLLFRGNFGTTGATQVVKKGQGVRMGRRGKESRGPQKVICEGKHFVEGN